MRQFNSACILLLLAMVAGCAATAPGPQGAPETTFFPLPPDPPRIQYLATFDRAGSVGKARSDLADFVLGEEGKTEALKRPYGSAFFDGRIYVADSKAPAIVVFDLAARRYSTFAGTGAGRLQQPINITIDADGSKFVTDTMRNQVLVYDRADRFVAAFGAKGEFKPVDTAIAGDRLFVVDVDHHQVITLDKRTGNRLSAFGKPGSAPGQLYHPTNIAIGPEGDLYVADTGNFRVSRFRPDGTFVRTFGEAGQSPGTFARPKGIAVDRAGRVYVGDAAFQNVQIFDADGRILMAFGRPWDGKQGLNLPAGVAIDYDNLALMKPYADPDFTLEYLILVVSQFGPNKVDVFGFGRKRGAAYPEDSPPAATGKR